jgi:hypothetical protein
MQVASMGQLATLAKLQGEAWANLLEILNGKYKVAGSKTVGGPPPNAISHFNMMGHNPHPVCAGFFKDIIECKLALKNLPATCTRWKPPTTCSSTSWRWRSTRADKHIKGLGMLAKVFPALCTQKFIDGWVQSSKVKHDKISDTPPALKEAIQAQCEDRKVHRFTGGRRMVG